MDSDLPSVAPRGPLSSLDPPKTISFLPRGTGSIVSCHTPHRSHASHSCESDVRGAPINVLLHLTRAKDVRGAHIND